MNKKNKERLNKKKILNLQKSGFLFKFQKKHYVRQKEKNGCITGSRHFRLILN